MTAEVLEMIGELKASGTQFVMVTHEMGFARRVADDLASSVTGKFSPTARRTKSSLVALYTASKTFSTGSSHDRRRPR